MVDFLWITTRSPKRGVTEIYPKFIIKKSSDLMIRGGDFYAVWLEDKGLWSTDEQDLRQLIDGELDRYAEEHKNEIEGTVRVLHMWDAESGTNEQWLKYCQRHMRDSFHMLDENLIFSNIKTKKEDYASKRLSYPLEKGDHKAYDELMSTLYSPEERRKIEWAIGSIVSGDSKKNQKFMVLYGAAGTGKSTVLNIIQDLFEGYYSVFDAKSLGSSNNAFALEAFKNNPLVALQHDGDLSRLEDNTRLNSLVSHELMTVNEKFKSTYSTRFKCFLFIGTNDPVKITNAKSGLLRRLIDVTPTGNVIKPVKKYKALVNQIKFELGPIAYHCLQVYKSDPGYYDNYVPTAMLGASNDFYNFVVDSYHVFSRENGTTLKAAWEMYKVYCDEAKVAYPFSQRIFKEELKNYFEDYKERFTVEDGSRVRSYYEGFKKNIFIKNDTDEETGDNISWLTFESDASCLDKECASCPAQYASSKETPRKKWDKVKTVLSDLDTKKLHYVKVPDNHIVIDFDIPDEQGNKCLEKNLEAASKWPATYAELSKSGQGIHLHYIYTGDANDLSRVYDDYIEIKVASGNSSLRRKLTKCNDRSIATISSGLPLKEKGDSMIDSKVVKSEKGLRRQILRNLNKEIHPSTNQSISFIHKILEDAYKSGLKYDLRDMYWPVYIFASKSTHHAKDCKKLVNAMHFSSDNPDEEVSIYTGDPNIEPANMTFFDIEVFKNLLVVCWKPRGEQHKCVKMINPSREAVEELLKLSLVGFNCRRYDNHILYAYILGATINELYKTSHAITNGGTWHMRPEANKLSYTDVYDFASAGNKKSLKKLEIEMGEYHLELPLRWDEPVPEDKWELVAEYCANDVIATEAAFNYLHSDWTARKMLAYLAGMTVNDTTNALTQRIVLGTDKHPQKYFKYRNLAEPVFDLSEEEYEFLSESCPEMMSQTHGEAGSLLPYFPGYKNEGGVSTYRGEVIGEGGRVFSIPKMYGNVALLDITSMHPHSTIAESLFGIIRTKRFRELVRGRVYIKQEEWDELENILDGKLVRYVQKIKSGEESSENLANALKTAINAVYGQTKASYENPFRDIRNKDNIVAKRGALFMTDLKYEVQKRGFIVAHIKTDSIKIPDATPEIIQFVYDFGKRYGYTFEHEATYEKMCLVNDSVYIAKYDTPEKCMARYGYVPKKVQKHGGEWTATGTQFKVPYVFKTLFSKEPIDFEDLCETKSVTTSLYLDMNESLPDVSELEAELDKAKTKRDKGKISEEEYTEIEARLTPEIEKGHNYRFVGRVGQFTPVKDGAGGGLLMREKDGKYYAVSGTSGYRWLESESMRLNNTKGLANRKYYNHLVDEAVDAINEHGDFEWFVSDEEYIGPLYENGIPIYPDGKTWN